MAIDIPLRFFVSTGKTLQSGSKELGMARKWTGNSTDKKAIESVKSWRGGHNLPDDWEPDVIENVPVVGFEIVGYVSRCRTDNKWFEVVDPRGFKLQITCENLLDVIRDETIVNGVVQSECVWGFDRHVYLMGTQGSLYKNAMKTKSKSENRKKVSGSKLVVGEVYEKGSVGNSRPAIYLGRASAKANIQEYSRYRLFTYENKDVEDHGLYLFVNLWHSELNNKNYNPNSYVKLSLTKSCPQIFESDKTTVHDTQTIKGWIEKANSLSVPDFMKKQSGISSVGNSKFLSIVAPEIGLDKTY